MSYYFEKSVDGTMASVRERVQAALATEGFGVLTEIDVEATMQKKLGKTMKPYVILGACHPDSAYQALQAEPKIGTMLPCNVILREIEDGRVEVAAVDPVASMQSVQNPSLGAIASDIRERLRRVVDSV